MNKRIKSIILIILIGLTLIGCNSAYIVNFDSMGGTEVSTIDVQKGSTISIPSVTREGYTLVGWYTSLNDGETLDEKWSFTSNTISNDITLYAKWIINEYTITFDSNGGNNINSITQDYDTTVNESAEPTRGGYTFGGWYSDDELTITYSFTAITAEDIILYAKWTINQYTITFDSNEGASILSITQDYDTTVNGTTESTRGGYTFGGWYSDEELTITYTFTTMPAEDITLYAKWDTITYDITYQLGGGINGNNPDIYTAETNTIILNVLTKENYTFEGWFNNAEFTGDAVTEITLGSTGDMTLYAKWTVNQYTITYATGINVNGLVPLLHQGEIITQISLGSWHSLAITSTGRVFTWGNNGYGQLGDGTINNSPPRSTLTEITTQFNLSDGETIIQISLGDYHSSAITSTGRVFTWGSNEYGQLGDGTTTDRYTPTAITSQFNLVEGETITQIYLGGTHSSAITSEGRVFTWGRNDFGELGDGTTTNRFTPTEIISKFNLNEGETITQISLGGSEFGGHSSVITSEGRVFTWGRNDSGQLGDGTTTNRYTPKFLSIYTIINVEIYDFDEGTNEYIPSMIGYIFSGWYSDQELTIPYLFTTMPSENIVLYGEWNIITYNITYQLVDGINGNNPDTYTVDTGTITLDEPIKEGYTYSGWFDNEELTGEAITEITLGTTGDITLYTKWTVNQYTITYAIGTNVNANDLMPLLHQGEIITQITFGGGHSSAITSLGRIFTWGRNDSGQLGDGTTTNRSTPTEITSQFNLSEGETITQISLGFYHSSAITSLGRIFTWGRNSNRQLGDGTTTDRYIPTEITSQFNLSEGETITQISLGESHSSAITSEGRVFTWGRNDSGQLGDGTTTGRYTPIEITSQFNLSEGETITQISLDGTHSSAITSEGRVFTWGRNDYGQLGDGTHDYFVAHSTPIEITNQFELNAGEIIIQIFLGGGASSAIASSGRIFTWGDNTEGQLGDGTTTDRYTPKFLSIYTRINGEIYDFNEDTTEYIPSMIGYTFSGWYSDQELTIPYIFTTMPAENITLYAKREIDLLENIDKDYYVTGQFNGFDTVLSGLMTAISICDGRISSIQTDLEGVKYLYIAEVTFLDTDAGWTVAYTIDGTDYILNGNLTVRIIRTIIGDSDTRDWWAQSPESGAITNLTSDTLYIPPFVEEDIDQAGTWNDNLVVYIAGTYYAVFAEFADGTRGLALIPVE